MRRGKTLFALISVVLVTLGLLGCNQVSEEELKAAQAVEEWAWLEKTKADLESKRGELADLRDRIANGSTEETAPETAEEGTEAEAPPTAEDLEAQATAVEFQATNLAEEFTGRLIQFINDQGIGSEPTDVQRQALAMKSDEDILVANEYISKGGEYQRAIDIYNQALQNDPDNEKLAAAKAHAEVFRFITEERLATVKKKMTEDEVRALLGTPKVSNVREYDNGKTIGWFFARAEPRGAAAAVFFQKKGDVLKVYKTDFDAVKPAS